MLKEIRFVKRISATIGLVALISLLALAVGCGGGASAPPITATSSSAVQIKMGDDPDDSVLAFELTVNSVVLSKQGGGSVSALLTPTTLELTHLADTNQPLSLLNIQQGTYTEAQISVSNPEIVYLNGLGQAVEKQLNLSATVTIAFNPPLVVGPGSSVVNFDLNLARSVSINLSSGAVTVNPVFVVTTSAVPPAGQEDQENEEDGGLQDMWGIVSGTTSSSFTMSVGMSGQSLTFTVDSNTAFENIGGLSQMSAGMLVRVNAVTQPNGVLLAKRVTAVEMDNASEADGVITAVTGSPATQLAVLDQDGVGLGMTAQLLGGTLNVDVNSSTVFSVSEDLDLSNLQFTPVFSSSSVMAGQRVEADTNAGVSPSGTLTASNVELRRQAVHGIVSGYGPGLVSGQFTFTLNLPVDSYLTLLSHGAVKAITVVQQPTTELRNLSAVSDGANLRVRGALFWTGSGFTMVASRIVAVQ
jgi:hypothetical protein